MPHYAKILDFIDLRARASENTLHEVQKRHSSNVPTKTSMTKTMYVTNMDTSCMVCGAGKHPLYTNRKFKSMSMEQQTDLAKSTSYASTVCSQDTSDHSAHPIKKA